MGVFILGIPIFIAAIAAGFLEYWKWNCEQADKRNKEVE